MSTDNTDHFERSLVVGESAFSSLIEDTVPVWPEMYEVLYAYESGQNIDVISAIDGLKKNNDNLTPEDLRKIHDDLFSSNGLMDASEDIGSRISNEIRNIVTAMNTAGQRSDECDNALRKIETKFSNVSTAEQLHGMVAILSDITRAMTANNQNLNTKLKHSSQQIEYLHKDLEKVRNESNTDALTGLANRKKFDSTLHQSVDDISLIDNKLCLLMVDIDFFKRFNDTHGHQTGDQILRLVAMTLKNGLKGSDLPARYGGEEFGVILPDTNSKNAYIVAEQIRNAIANKELIKKSTGENMGRLTVSIGIAEAKANDTPSSLIERADKALYKAKETGRDRCVIAPEDSVENRPEIAV